MDPGITFDVRTLRHSNIEPRSAERIPDALGSAARGQGIQESRYLKIPFLYRQLTRGID